MDINFNEMNESELKEWLKFTERFAAKSNAEKVMDFNAQDKEAKAQADAYAARRNQNRQARTPEGDKSLVESVKNWVETRRNRLRGPQTKD